MPRLLPLCVLALAASGCCSLAYGPSQCAAQAKEAPALATPALVPPQEEQALAAPPAMPIQPVEQRPMPAPAPFKPATPASADGWLTLK